MTPREARIGKSYRMTCDFSSATWDSVTITRKTKRGVFMIDDKWGEEFMIEYQFMGQGHHLHETFEIDDLHDPEFALRNYLNG